MAGALTVELQNYRPPLHFLRGGEKKEGERTYLNYTSESCLAST